MLSSKKRRGITRNEAILVILLLLVAAVFLGYIKIPNINLNSVPSSPSSPPPTTGGAAPLFITLNDPLNGVSISSATVYLLNPSTGQVLSTVTISSGTGTSPPMFTPGQQVVAKVVASGYVTRFVPITVPSTLSSTTSCSNCVYSATINDIKLGSPTIKIVDNLGNSYTSGSSLNFSTLGVSSITLTVTVYNTLADSGWVSSQDVVNNQIQNLAMQITTPGTSVSVTNLQNPVTRGSSSYWTQIIPDGYIDAQVQPGGFSTQTIGTNVIGGVTSFTFTVSKSALAHGSTQAFTFTLYDYASAAVFAAQGSYGPNAAVLGSAFTLTFAA